jgi:TM2 domain-containing membrane protein YozV
LFYTCPNLHPGNSELAGVKYLLLFLVCSFVAANASATEKNFTTSPDTLQPDSLFILASPDSLQGTMFTPVREENPRFIAALLAFPVPFGFLGAHRIYLGTAPWMPVVYTVTLGGAGLLCLADFFAIVFADEETFRSYQQNGKIFMWMR